MTRDRKAVQIQQGAYQCLAFRASLVRRAFGWNGT